MGGLSNWARLSAGLCNHFWLGVVSGCAPQLGDAAGWIPCSGRAAHRASWMDKASDCAMPLGRDVDYAVKLCVIVGWVLDQVGHWLYSFVGRSCWLGHGQKSSPAVSHSWVGHSGRVVV